MISRCIKSLPFAAGLFLCLALVQIFVYTTPLDSGTGKWFVYGRDTLAHDAVVHQWIHMWNEKEPGSIPLWMPELHGGLPTIGAFLWTPLAPAAWGFPFLVYPDAQRLGWLISIWLAGIGGWLLARAMGIRPMGALFAGMAWMLCGHVVTLMHAGHFQKVMALGWYPWMVAGGVMALQTGSNARRLTGIALGALGLGMMLLSGHPQIAYTGIATVGFLALGYTLGRRKARLDWKRWVPSLALLGALGIGLGGAQFLPGVEMSGWSNRAEGVDWEEAIATSYPPGELAEFVVPRVKGSSVFGDEYTGEWGDERIVSDYIGMTVVILAFIGLVRSRGKRFVVLLPWLVVIIASLVVGMGSYTPVYRVLFDFFPGFDSFRSPGTFMCAASLGLAVLAGAGLDNLVRLTRESGKPFVGPMVFAGLFLVASSSLLRANNHFLLRFNWDRYRVEFREANDVDKWLAERNLQLDVFDTTNDLSLRPILFGRKAINGYHPITWKAKSVRDHEEDMYSISWYEAWGVPILLAAKPVEYDETVFNHLESFPREERMALKILGASGHSDGHGLQSVQWVNRHPNHRHVIVRGWGGWVRFADNIAPGWNVFINNERIETPREPEMEIQIQYEEGKHEIFKFYTPFSWRAGLFMTALSLFGIALCMGMGRRPRY
ncbi:MAG: hypothetical protein JJU11_15020 [Candidatus Sumerlaeia bacterium]|nr:hypothetical protein [Candidatus Sumerlaeia bacterium]